MLLYGSHAAYRCLRLIAAIDAVDSDAETVQAAAIRRATVCKMDMRLCHSSVLMPLARPNLGSARGPCSGL